MSRNKDNLRKKRKRKKVKPVIGIMHIGNIC